MPCNFDFPAPSNLDLNLLISPWPFWADCSRHDTVCIGSLPLTVNVTTMGYKSYKNPLNKAPLRTVTGRANDLRYTLDIPRHQDSDPCFWACPQPPPSACPPLCERIRSKIVNKYMFTDARTLGFTAYKRMQALTRSNVHHGPAR